MTTLYLFYTAIGFILGFLLYGPLGIFIGGFLGFLYGAGQSHRKKNEELIYKKIEELEREINIIKNSNS